MARNTGREWGERKGEREGWEREVESLNGLSNRCVLFIFKNVLGGPG